jgi:O-antigen/teichoic acid export membrane protein
LSGIRVTYTGLISLIGGIISIFTGIIFTLIITRSVTAEEYGTWGLILGLVTYVMLIGPIVSYWSTRDTARNIQSGKTAIWSSMLLSIGAISVYIPISYLMSNYTNVENNVLLFAAILVPTMFINGILVAINLGWKPHAISYGTLAYGISSIPLALFLIYYLNFGVTGIIISVFLANIVSIIILFYYAKEKIVNRFNKAFLKKWLKFSWIPIYPGIAVLVTGFDISIFTIITGSVIGLAFWTAAMVFPAMISHTGLISRAIYAKLLEEKTKEFMSENLTLVFYFGIILISLVITFARPALYALNPIYEIAFPVAIIMSFEVFLSVFTNIFLLSLAGIERVDKFENSTFKDYLKSKLFFPQTIRLIQTCIYVLILTVGLLILVGFGSSNQELLLFWASIALITQIPLVCVLYYLVQKNIMIKLEISRIAKFALIAIGVFGFTYVLTNQFLVYSPDIASFIPNVLMFASFGVGLYIIITYLIDNKIRNLVHAVIYEIKTKKS